MRWRAQIRLALGSLRLDVDVTGNDRPVALIGPNGAGKTTFLRTIAGAHRPAAGRIEVGDDVLFDAARGIDRPAERRRVGYVPQGYGLFPHLDVLDNVAFGLRRVDSVPRSERRERARDALNRVGSGHLAGRQPSALSGGEQQQVALARALVVDPGLLLLDEPLAALDAPTRRRLRAHLAEHLAERGKPAVIVTHDARDVAALDADVHALDDGRIVQIGSLSELAAEPATAFVAEFIDVPR